MRTLLLGQRPKRTCCASPISESHGDVALVLPPADRVSEAAVQVAWEQFERHRGDGNSQKAPEALKKNTLFFVCARGANTNHLNRPIARHSVVHQSTAVHRVLYIGAHRARGALGM